MNNNNIKISDKEKLPIILGVSPKIKGLNMEFV